MQRRHWGGRLLRRLPPSNGPGVRARVGVVTNAWEPPPHLDGGRQFAFLLEDGADRGGIGFGDDERGRNRIRRLIEARYRYLLTA
jgi:hypothetical protein